MIGDGIVPALAQIVAGRMGQAEILGDVVLHAGIEAAGEIGQRAAGVGDQQF